MIALVFRNIEWVLANTQDESEVSMVEIYFPPPYKSVKALNAFHDFVLGIRCALPKRAYIRDVVNQSAQRNPKLAPDTPRSTIRRERRRVIITVAKVTGKELYLTSDAPPLTTVSTSRSSFIHRID
jgi:hypothetical protein